jgi:hypothetical protein
MDQDKRAEIDSLLKAGTALREIERLTGVPLSTVQRYSKAGVPGDKRSRLLEIFRTARREGNAREMRIAARELDKLDNAANPKPKTGMQPDFVAAVSQALGFWENKQSEASPMDDADLLDTLAQRHAGNERILAAIARVKSLVLEISLPPELEAVVTAYETEEADNEHENATVGDSESGETRTGE